MLRLCETLTHSTRTFNSELGQLRIAGLNVSLEAETMGYIITGMKRVVFILLWHNGQP